MLKPFANHRETSIVWITSSPTLLPLVILVISLRALGQALRGHGIPPGPGLEGNISWLDMSSGCQTTVGKYDELGDEKLYTSHIYIYIIYVDRLQIHGYYFIFQERGIPIFFEPVNMGTSVYVIIESSGMTKQLGLPSMGDTVTINDP